MQTLGSNQQTIYYALLTGETMATDSDGHKTGERVKTFADPVAFRINVSAAKGTADVEQFGINTDYTRTMVTHDLTCPISEDSHLWVGISSSEEWNYTVQKVAKSLNFIAYAIKERS